ncbi:HAD hydrolase-like protein [bacterium]|nr:HAD hydrolase-like protein [bacterium]
MKVLLFDIDGTILLTGGAGKRSMEDAFLSVYNRPLSDVPMAGRTDSQIFRHILRHHDIQWSISEEKKFKQAYFDRLELALSGIAHGARLCPGIHTLLTTLDRHDDCTIGLLTGNWKISAYMKLKYFNIDHYFNIGSFADDNEDRNLLLPAFMRRFNGLYGYMPLKDESFIIGDTPRDVEAALYNNVISIAVASGFASKQELLQSNPQYFFDDLEDTDAFIKTIGLTPCKTS